MDKTLAELKTMGIKVAVATATDEERAGRYLREIGIYDMFDKIICVNMVENGKPRPDIYLYACEQIGEAPGDCVAVEDSPNGVLSAVRAGLRTVMVPDLTQPEPDLMEIIYAKADHLGQIPDMIAEINAADENAGI